ncbi:MAG TPA: type II secretion system protein [Leptolyngbyaceae cyanobacterium M33_DOE_097]|nr:type II secretion system protein [Leptolyngbyaceae cyanobacterium M33_DOE_097]
MSISPRSYPPKLLLALRQQQRDASEQGLSLTECLVAIIILSLLGLAITPPMFLAAGTRVQARRADQANQIAQSEIDRVRSMVERGSSTLTVSDLPAIATATNLKDAAAATPTTTVSATNPLLTNAKCNSSSLYARDVLQVPVSSVVLVDQDGDCTPDYMMQVFRSQGNAATASDVPTSFQVGVRVYAITQGAASQTLMTDRTASLIIGTGPKDKVDGNKRRPLAVLYSTVTRSDTSGGLGGLCRQLGGTDTTCK